MSLNLPLLLSSFAVLLLSLSFHEAAHAWTANRLGDPTARLLGRITLNPLKHIDWIGTVLFPLMLMAVGAPVIGWAKPCPVDPRNFRSPRRDFALVAVAGPVSNLILATIAAVVFALGPRAWLGGEGAGATVANLFVLMILLNVLLAIFNMVPIPPLDGGNVLMGVAPLPVAQMINKIRPFGFLILYALMYLRVLDLIMRPVQNFLLSWLL